MHAASISVSSYVYQLCCVSKAVFIFCPPSLPALKFFPPHHLLQSSLSLRGSNWWRYLIYCWILQNLPVHCLLVGLSICSRLLQKESFLMMTEQGTDVWVQQNIVKSHFIVIFLLAEECIWLPPLGHWSIHSLVLGHPSNVRNGLHHMAWALNTIIYWLVTTKSFVSLLRQHILKTGHQGDSSFLVSYSILNLSGYLDYILLINDLTATILIYPNTSIFANLPLWVCVTSFSIGFFFPLRLIFVFFLSFF